MLAWRLVSRLVDQYMVPKFVDQNMVPKRVDENMVPRLVDQYMVPKLVDQNIWFQDLLVLLILYKTDALYFLKKDCIRSLAVNDFPAIVSSSQADNPALVAFTKYTE